MTPKGGLLLIINKREKPLLYPYIFGRNITLLKKLDSVQIQLADGHWR